jgi:hypothetical protein
LTSEEEDIIYGTDSEETLLRTIAVLLVTTEAARGLSGATLFVCALLASLSAHGV